MRKRKLSESVGFEQLELRRLLAADFCMQAMPESAATEPVICEFATFDCVADEVTTDSPVDSQVEVVDDEAVTPVESQVLDLADGMDGYFGAINAENPSELLEFTAPADGNVDVVISSSPGEGHVTLVVSNGQGEEVQSRYEQLDGFEKFRFEVEEGESYQMSVSADDSSCEGHFQLTAAFANHVDQHADVVGSESTALDWNDNSAGLSGRLESSGDTDTFRFAAAADGEVTMELHETLDDSRIVLNVAVEDSEGNMLAEGKTNEMLQVSFDVEEGQEYFVSLVAGEGQTGTYRFGLELTPAPQLPATDMIDSEVVGDTLDCEIAEPEVVDSEVNESEAGDPTEIDSGIVDSEVVDSSDDGPVVVDSGDESVENEGAVEDTELACEPVVGEATDMPTDEIADLPSGDANPADELADSIEEQPADDFSNVGTDCLESAPGVVSDSSDVNSDGNPATDLDAVDDELIADTGGDIAGNDLNNDEPADCFRNLETVDQVFVGFGGNFDWHIELSIGNQLNGPVLANV